MQICVRRICVHILMNSESREKKEKPGKAQRKTAGTNARTQKGEEKPARQAARQAGGHGQARYERRREKAGSTAI